MKSRMRAVVSVLALCLVLLCAGCATTTPTKTVAPAAGPRVLLFPYGTYTHDIAISLPSGKEYTFRGIVHTSEQMVRVVGLAFLNTTAFRIVEDRKTGAIDVDIYYQPMKKYEPRLRQFYGHLRTLLLLPVKGGDSKTVLRLAQDSDGFPLRLQTVGLEKDVEIAIDQYDDKKIPQKLRIDRPEFSVRIEVSAYEI